MLIVRKSVRLFLNVVFFLLRKFFARLAWIQVIKYNPIIIGITGNVGKTSAKEAIAAVLHGNGKNIRVAAGNLNNELGFALTILGDWDREYYEQGSSISLWLKVLWAGLTGLIIRRNLAEILLMEYGADRPGDIKRLTTLFKPHISVVTALGDTPVHVEFFNNVEAVAEEKANLVKILLTTDYAVLNNDDARVLNMKSKTKANVLTYGFKENPTVRISDFNYTKSNEGKLAGVAFKINKALDFEAVNIYGSLGKSQAYAAAAAAAVGTILGMDLPKIGEALLRYKGSNGRLKIISGISDSTIIDDTYNASPSSTQLALETLRELPALRKIAVLGNMLELGRHAVESHRNVGLITASRADILVCVGSLAKFIAETSKIPKDKIFIFNTSDEAKSAVRSLIRERDLILVKGSQGMRMEKIVAEIMAEPENKKELLVRQSKKWLSKL